MPVFLAAGNLEFRSPTTFFVGENGAESFFASQTFRNFASHSTMLLACPGADIYSFDSAPVSRIRYEDTEHYRVYREFSEKRTVLLTTNHTKGTKNDFIQKNE